MIKEQIKKDIGNILKKYCYEQNDNETRSNIVNDIASYLSIVKENKKIYDFKVICDDDNNTKKDIDNNRLKCRIALKFFPKDKKFTILDSIIEFENH